MDKSSDTTQRILQSSLPLLMLAILTYYVYAWLFSMPYLGFMFSSSNNIISNVYIERPGGVETGDRILKIGDVTWDEFVNDIYLMPFEELKVGDQISFEIDRGGETVSVNWQYPGMTDEEFSARLDSQWWFVYVFWLLGTATFIFVRPKDSRRRLMVAFSYLTASWLAVGLGPARFHLYGSAAVFRVAVWMCLPVYLHLHWDFPRPLRKLPRIILVALYGLGALLALAEVFQLIPDGLYYLGFVLALLGSVFLLGLHFWRQKAERRDLRLLFLSALLAIGPPVILSAFPEGIIPRHLIGGSVISLVLLPGAYFYTLYRRQLGGLELRANRVISVYLFAIIAGTLFVILYSLLDRVVATPAAGAILGVGLALLVVLFAIFYFADFQRFIERRFLGMPLPPTHLVQTYASRITTSLAPENLVALLRDEVLPSLLVRQSALVRVEGERGIVTFYADSLDEGQLPRAEEIASLVAEAGRFREALGEQSGPHPCPWARLVLPLRLGEETIGLWLLGRRDPDDYYSQAEVQVLQTLADQTAIALVNIQQASRLRELYQANIDRHEDERARLARDLHDDVLGELGAMFVKLDDGADADDLQQQYKVLADHLRGLISELRPAMLSYGLKAAIDELVDHLLDRAAGALEVFVDLSSTDAALDPQVELHLFRIVQQACENAFRHGQASNLSIEGEIGPGRVRLVIEDDGVGFAVDDGLDLSGLVTEKHFGLAGMLERAALIGAQVKVDSRPGEGTRVELTWENSALRETN